MLATTSPRLPYRLAPDVVLVPVADGSARLLDLQGSFFALDEVAARLLRTTLGHGPEAAAESVAQHYGEDVARVRADLDAFLATLARKGVLLAADQPAPRPGLRQRMWGIAFSGLARLVRLRRSLNRQAGGLLTLARMACRRLGWAQTVRLWQRLFPRPDTALTGAAAEVARRSIDEAVREALAQAALAHACKERGLTAWALARSVGLGAELIVGLCLYPLHAHCWARLDGTCLGDEPERCADYDPVCIYE